MLPLQVNIASITGLAGSAYVASRVSRRGSMHVDRLWIVPVVTLLIVRSARRPIDGSRYGLTAMALGLAIGVFVGWKQARASLVSVDVPARRFVIRSDRSAMFSVIALGAVVLLLSNLFSAQMLRITNAALLVGIGSTFANRIYMLSAYLRARHQSADVVTGDSAIATLGENLQ